MKTSIKRKLESDIAWLKTGTAVMLCLIVDQITPVLYPVIDKVFDGVLGKNRRALESARQLTKEGIEQEFENKEKT